MPDQLDLPAAVRTFFDATNAGDSARFVAAFAEHGSLDDWGQVRRGREAIAGWDRTDNIGVHAHLVVTGVGPGDHDGQYVVSVTVTGDGFNGPSTFTFDVADDLISSLVIR